MPSMAFSYRLSNMPYLIVTIYNYTYSFLMLHTAKCAIPKLFKWWIHTNSTIEKMPLTQSKKFILGLLFSCK